MEAAAAVAVTVVVCVLAELAQAIMLVFATSAAVMDIAPRVLVRAHSMERLFLHLQVQDGTVRPFKEKIIPTWGFVISLAIMDIVLPRPAGLSGPPFDHSNHSRPVQIVYQRMCINFGLS